jgi:hypothetical protein
LCRWLAIGARSLQVGSTAVGYAAFFRGLFKRSTGMTPKASGGRRSLSAPPRRAPAASAASG